MNRQVAKSAKSENRWSGEERKIVPTSISNGAFWRPLDEKVDDELIAAAGLLWRLWRLNFDTLGHLAKAAKKSVFVKVSLDGAGPMAIVRSDSR